MPRSADAFARRLLDWFRHSGRHDLPWQVRDAYRVWVSEIMLQQTQVATVIPYYERFMARFPTLERLAEANLDDVLAHWSGLGYYARARNLHRAARIALAEHGGALPRTAAALEALPGIGRSTAAAILALAHDERHAILDGNVKRVLARFHAVAGWPGETAVQRTLWNLAERHTPERDVAAYTQAIMDLGATLCTRAQPRCDRCPVGEDCAARALGIEATLPAPRPKRARRQEAVTVLVVANTAGETLLERRPPTGIWGGLLSLPELGEDETAAAWCSARFGAAPASEQPLAPIDHSFTHFDLELRPVLVELDTAPGAIMDRDRWLWYNASQPLPGGIAAPIAKLLAELGQQTRRTA